jgi:copper chaperone NosL
VTHTQRVIIAGAALALLAAFVLPLWRIDLIAPQYPEGIGMVIRINTVQGAGPSDLQKINGLNHYIGMRVIDPSSIPELRWMPWLVGALALIGVGAAVTGRRGIVAGWLGACLAAAAAGLVDFYRWEYDYGHHLDLDRAIIKIPGMSYQPPLIGSKQLLNFTATSYPAGGAWVLVGVFVVVVAVLALRRPRQSGVHPAHGWAAHPGGLASHVSSVA